MNKVEPSQDEVAHFSSFDLIQKKMIEKVFEGMDLFIEKDESETSWTHQTKFYRSIPMIYATLYRYMPKDMRTAIKQAFDTIEKKVKEIDEDKNLSEGNKRINKRRIEDEYGGQILQLCVLALQYSPVNTELKEIIMTSDRIDFEGIIKKIRSNEPLGLFSDKVVDAL